MKQPVRGAYALADMTIRCRHCGAEPQQPCQHPDGTPRRIPCLYRIKAQPDRYGPHIGYDRDHGH